MSVLIHVGVRASDLQVDPLLARRFGAARCRQEGNPLRPDRRRPRFGAARRRQEGDPLRPDRRLPQFCRVPAPGRRPPANTCPAWSTTSIISAAGVPDLAAAARRLRDMGYTIYSDGLGGKTPLDPDNLEQPAFKVEDPDGITVDVSEVTSPCGRAQRSIQV